MRMYLWWELQLKMSIDQEQKHLYMTQSALDSVFVGASMLVNELYAVVDGAVCVTLGLETAVRTPAITDDCSAGFDPVTK
jgi:hypothetical protein